MWIVHAMVVELCGVRCACGLSLIFGLASIASAVLDLVIRDRVGTQGRQTQTARGPRPTRGVAVGATPPVHLPDRPARCE